MFPPQIMDKYLKLKLELAYRDLSVEQARQFFDRLKEAPEVTETELVIPKPAKRKRIPGKKSKWMPQASSFTNKVRADAEGRNMKKQYPGAILQQNYLGSLMCTSYVNPPWWVPTKYIYYSKWLTFFGYL